MRDELAPKGQQEVGIDTGETRDDVAFPGVDGLLGGVGVMHLGWCKLECGANLGD